MRSKLILTSTRGMSREDWLTFRLRGVGASEVGAVMGLDDYTSSLELFYRKIGDLPMMDFESMAAFMGRELEDLIATLWQYWEGEDRGEEAMIANYREGRIVRRCQRVNAYIQNPDFPWMFVSLDRKIMAHDGRREGALELKSIGKWEADKWEVGIPPKWVTQMNAQMGVCEFDYSEMAQLGDGRRFGVLPFSPSPVIWQQIVVQTQDFWDRVLKARPFVNQKQLALLNYNQRLADECQAEIEKLAPEPDGTEAYAKFLSDKFQLAKIGERPGTFEELDWAKQHAEVSGEIKNLEERKRLMENRLKAAMGENMALDFRADGKVYWGVDSRGKRIFRNKLKP
jgi:putative phage-type endonuclease